MYENSTPAAARLAGSTSSTLAVLTQTGNGSVSAAPVWTSSTGTGNVVLSTSPTLATPALGTPSSVTLTNATGLPCAALPALTGDTTTSAASCATTTAKINGTAFPASATVIGSNSSSQPVSATTTGSGSVVLATTPSLSSPSLGTTAHTSTYTSNASTINLLQVLTTVSNASRATNAATTTTSGVVGIAQSTVSAGSSVEVATSGKATCQFDATAVTAGDYVQISSTTAGDCHDAGSTRPASGQIIGFALATGSASTTQVVRLFDGEVMAVPVPSATTVATQESTSSTSYVNLTTSGPAVTVTVSSSGKALVTLTGALNNTTGTCYMAFAVSGATTSSASDTLAVSAGPSPEQMSATYLVTGLTAGSNTFTAKYRSSDGSSCQFSSRNVIVIPY